MPTNKTTAHVSPEEMLRRERREAAFTLSRALAQVTDSREETGAALDCAPSRISAFVDPEHSATMCVARARMLPAAAARVVAQYVAGPGALVIDVPSDSEIVTLADISRSQKSTSMAVTEALDGVADGHLTHAEGMRLEAAADKAIADLWRLRHAARLAQRERVLALPRKAVTA